MPLQSTTSTPPYATPRQGRLNDTQLTDHFRQQQKTHGTSQRLFAREHQIPRSSLQYRLGERKLQSLTAVHNYWIKRGDGTTAAERFFGSKPADLFEYLLEQLPLPPRPAKRRSKAA